MRTKLGAGRVCAGWFVVLALAASGGSAVPANGTILYSSGIFGLREGASPTASTTFGLASIVGGPNEYQGVGDDYFTGFQTITLNGMSFYGGADVDGLVVYIEFFDVNRNLVQVLSGTFAKGKDTVKDLTFAQSFQVPGAGYIAFEPDTLGIEGPAGGFFLGIADKVDIGDNNATTSLFVDDNHQTYVRNQLFLDTQGTQDVSDILSFEFRGDTLLIPEPTACLAPAVVAPLLIRRRR